MLRSILTAYKIHWAIFTLIILSILICTLNYTPGTFLSGWDTLHPEFDFALNLKRTLFGVFRTEQGLGAVAAHAHMAELPRILLLYFFHFFLPVELLRYAYTFLCLIVGPIGMYLFLKNSFTREAGGATGGSPDRAPGRAQALEAVGRDEGATGPAIETISFLGALFYLLNLGTLQIFNVPFEMFTTLYAALPFIFLLASECIKRTSYRSNLLLFSLVILLTAPSAYASTLWFVFYASFFIYFLIFSLLQKSRKIALKRFLILNVAMIVLNSFWLLPNIYFLLTQAGNVQNAAINQLFSEEAFLKNREFATLPNFLLLKNFYFDWAVWNGSKFVQLLAPFIKHLASTPGLIASILVALSVIAGFIYFVYRQKKHALPLIALFLISLFFLAPGPLFGLISHISPTFKEAFRFPQDKVLNIAIFVFSIFFAYCFLFVSNLLKHTKYKIHDTKYLVVAFSFLLVIFMLPAFTGNLINRQMRIALPHSYFELFSYLKSEPGQAKVAPLPAASPWGWVYYDWGRMSFQGAGFLYFGIDKPLLDRDFDRWSPYNEQYYQEMSQAIYSKDASRLRSVIKKYNIGYLLLDTSVIAPGTNPKSLFLPETKDLLEKLRGQNLLTRKQFGHNLFVYKVIGVSSKTLETINKITPVAPSANSYSNDFIYGYLGNYFEKPGTGLFFPARSILKNTFETVGLNIKKDKIVISLPKMNYSMITKGSVSKRLTTSLIIEKLNGSSLLTFYPDLFYLNDNPIGTPFATQIDSNSTLMSVNESVFTLANITLDTPTSLGKAYLSGKANKVELYDDQVDLDTNSTLNPLVAPCDTNQPQGGHGISSVTSFISGNTMRVVNSTNDKICLRLALSDFVTSPGLGKISFEYKGTSKISACLKAKTEEDCINTPLVVEANFNKTFYFKAEASDLKSSDFVIELDPQSTKADDALTFTDFGLISPVNSTTFDLSPLDKAIWPPKAKNEISIPINITPDTYYDITREKRLDNDCQNLPSVSGKTILANEDMREIRYESAVGSFCDHFSYLRLAHFEPYLLVLETKNETGLPLTVCVSSPATHRCTLNFKAKKNPDYQKQVFLLPALGNDGFGYDLNIENLGIKGTPGVNYLKSATFIPFPYEELLRFYGFKNTDDSTLRLKGEIVSQSQPFPGTFNLRTDGKPVFINLPYSFEPGFKLYEANASVVSLIFPFFSPEVKNHVVTNGWSNGWYTDGKATNYLLVYWPQYLEFLGLLLLPLYFLYLFSRLSSFNFILRPATRALRFWRERNQGDSSQTCRGGERTEPEVKEFACE